MKGLDLAVCLPLGPSAATALGPRLADAVRGFPLAGFTSVEIMVSPGTMEAFEALARVAEGLASD